MPVTFNVSPVAPCEIRTHGNQDPVQILLGACNPPPDDMTALLQCSIGEDEHRTLCANSNGFVHAVINAYGGHHHLVIRYVRHIAHRHAAELTFGQSRRRVDHDTHSAELLVSHRSHTHEHIVMSGLVLAHSVNAHAEELRAYFVAHEGTRKLAVDDVGTRHDIDFGRFARAMTQEIHKNVRAQPSS